MKAYLVEDLIIAHCSGSETQFATALNALVEDEKKKGNFPTATRFRETYEAKKRASSSNGMVATEPASVHLFPSSQLAPPRDCDSLLELYEVEQPTIRLDDIVLSDSQRKIIQQFIVEQNNTSILQEQGLPVSNKLLLCGPPGCGKTMTAYAIGNALQLPVAYVRIDGLISSYLWQTSTNLRRIFDSVKRTRIVLFLDEFDAIAKKRDDMHELGELKRVVTTLLQNFDKMPDNVILIAATNHEHLLDSAIWRRFNCTISLGLPMSEQRRDIVEQYLQRYSIHDEINVDMVVTLTEGMSYALLAELMIAVAKKRLISGTLDTSDVISILIGQRTKHSDAEDAYMETLCELVNRGISLRAVAGALEIPHSTLDYRIKKYRGRKHDGKAQESTSLDT